MVKITDRSGDRNVTGGVTEIFLLLLGGRCEDDGCC